MAAYTFGEGIRVRRYGEGGYYPEPGMQSEVRLRGAQGPPMGPPRPGPHKDKQTRETLILY